MDTVMAKCAHMLLGSRERTSQKPSELSETWDGNSDCTASRTIEIFQCSATRYKKANQAPEWHEYVSHLNGMIDAPQAAQLRISTCKDAMKMQLVTIMNAIAVVLVFK
ncbi:predicted protein [Plenodomus lingam JN3]|uniref:Predicted protein n=1 Tax=Leptosphaeria maculans (strain JN3 / isolate v23.1.3 / race Av1-4-5-6-7-8) TaxID=985895 RepID=E4ZQS7_LEPMJ|nr:predicted protein [Plenodomus lingam JN3]CBX94082.1 predicted protein [Plenodomus lingam JN3]